VSCLVTGARGFIGSHLVSALDEPEQCDIDRVGVLSPVEAVYNIYESDIEAVYHLGAISSTTNSDIESISHTNITFSCSLLSACIEKDIPFIYASSASVYGLGKNGFSEDSQHSPLNYYAISKSSFDWIARQKIRDNPSSRIVGLRYFNVYGTGESHKNDMASPIHKFLNQSNNTGVIKLFEGSENFSRDFIHISDVINITEAAIDFSSGIYNVGTGIDRTFLDVAKIISQLTNSDIIEIPFPNYLIGKYQDFTRSDNSKIDSVFNPSRVSLEDGIREVHLEDGIC
jgi:ADP-L-glycero-D-manno-heptose 6-epimerase